MKFCFLPQYFHNFRETFVNMFVCQTDSKYVAPRTFTVHACMLSYSIFRLHKECGCCKYVKVESLYVYQFSFVSLQFPLLVAYSVTLDFFRVGSHSALLITDYSKPLYNIQRSRSNSSEFQARMCIVHLLNNSINHLYWRTFQPVLNDNKSSIWFATLLFYVHMQ